MAQQAHRPSLLPPLAGGAHVNRNSSLFALKLVIKVIQYVAERSSPHRSKTGTFVVCPGEVVPQLTAISESAYTKSVEIRFSRHAKNKMRLYKLTPEDVKEAINSGEKLTQRDKWESRHGKLRVIWLMVGSYALVVTVIKTK